MGQSKNTKALWIALVILGIGVAFLFLPVRQWALPLQDVIRNLGPIAPVVVAIGMLPGSFLYVYLGATARRALTGGANLIFTLISLGATIAVVMVVTRAARKAMTRIEVESRATAGLNTSEAQ